jgi:hypothetical protein
MLTNSTRQKLKITYKWYTCSRIWWHQCLTCMCELVTIIIVVMMLYYSMLVWFSLAWSKCFFSVNNRQVEFWVFRTTYLKMPIKDFRSDGWFGSCLSIQVSLLFQKYILWNYCLKFDENCFVYHLHKALLKLFFIGSGQLHMRVIYTKNRF